MSGKARLTYSIYEGLLTGTANNKPVHIFALSGGGGGSTSHRLGAIDPSLVNNPDATGVKTTDNKTGHHHGGPIPLGSYTVSAPFLHSTKDGKHSFQCVRLTPDKDNHMMGRDGFLIHGTGKHGSDGCIVPTNAAAFHGLMSALSHDGGGRLIVISRIGDDTVTMTGSDRLWA